MNLILDRFEPADFLKDYWQKRPCVIKQFVIDFVDPIDEHDLAGLAQEPDVDSRIVSRRKDKWQVTQGPFSEFSACRDAWTLLVQGVDRYIEEVDQLTSLASFIPAWRLDDVMVSYSVAGAGVGPHVDEYDVIIIQGKGSRRWQVGLPNDSPAIFPHKLLTQIAGFDPVIDTQLDPGDAIYIPPRHPHNGVALSPCLNYSIGFRAPTDVELLTGILDEHDFTRQQCRYADRDILELRAANDRYLAVSEKEIAALTRQLSRLIESPQMADAMLQFLSRQGLPEYVDAQSVSAQTLMDAFANGWTLQKMPGVRPVVRQSQSNQHYFIFYIDGQAFTLALTAALSTDTESVIEQLHSFLESQFYEFDATVLPCNVDCWLTLLSELVSLGYWQLCQPEQ